MAITWTPNIRVDIDPDARKDYTFDFTQWLASETGDISDYEIIAPSSITVDQSTREGAEVTFWVSDVPLGTTERVTVRLTMNTTPVLIDDFSILFRGVQQ